MPASSAASRAVAVAAALVLVASLVARYRGKGHAAVLDTTDVLAVLVFAAAFHLPAVALGFAFSTLWFRALHGSARGAVGYAGTDSVQGFLHRRPGTAAEVVGWLAGRQHVAAGGGAVIPLARRRHG